MKPKPHKKPKMEEPLDAVRRMVAASLETPGTITAEDIAQELARLRREHALISSLMKTIERLAVLRYEDAGAASKRGPKVK
jgi:hypothetical protein